MTSGAAGWRSSRAVPTRRSRLRATPCSRDRRGRRGRRPRVLPDDARRSAPGDRAPRRCRGRLPGGRRRAPGLAGGARRARPARVPAGDLDAAIAELRAGDRRRSRCPTPLARRADLLQRSVAQRAMPGSAADDRATIDAIAHLAGDAASVYDRTLSLYLPTTASIRPRRAPRRDELAIRKDVYGYDAWPGRCSPPAAPPTPTPLPTGARRRHARRPAAVSRRHDRRRRRPTPRTRTTTSPTRSRSIRRFDPLGRPARATLATAPLRRSRRRASGSRGAGVAAGSLGVVAASSRRWRSRIRWATSRSTTTRASASSRTASSSTSSSTGRDPDLPGDGPRHGRRRRSPSGRAGRGAGRRGGGAVVSPHASTAARSPRAIATGASFPPGNGGLSTMRLVCDSRRRARPDRGRDHLSFADDFEAARIGWREIAVQGDGRDRRRPRREQRSGRLTAYPGLSRRRSTSATRPSRSRPAARSAARPPRAQPPRACRPRVVGRTRSASSVPAPTVAPVAPRPGPGDAPAAVPGASRASRTILTTAGDPLLAFAGAPRRRPRSAPATR